MKGNRGLSLARSPVLAGYTPICRGFLARGRAGGWGGAADSPPVCLGTVGRRLTVPQGSPPSETRNKVKARRGCAAGPRFSALAHYPATEVRSDRDPPVSQTRMMEVLELESCSASCADCAVEWGTGMRRRLPLIAPSIAFAIEGSRGSGEQSAPPAAAAA